MAVDLTRIRLINVSLEKSGNGIREIQNMMLSIPGIREIFSCHTDRAILSFPASLIYLDDTVVGFLNCVRERNNDKFAFIDIGILPEYRNMGISREVLRQLLQRDDDRFYIAETEFTNNYAKKSAENFGVKVAEVVSIDGDKETPCRVFYLLQKNRYQEFIVCNSQDELIKHIGFSINKENTKYKVKKI